MKSQPESVTKKQLEILTLLYRFRYLNRHHIQKFLNHKSHSLITTYLKDLTDRNIIGRHYSKTIPNIYRPATYFLSLNSRPILIEHGFDEAVLKRVYKEKDNSKAFQDHWLFIAELYFHFLETAQKHKAKFQFLTATDLKNYAFTPLKQPDVYIVVKAKNETKRYFLEVLNPSDPYFAVLSLVNKYIRYFEEGYWQNHYDYPFPKLLIIYPNLKAKKWLTRTIEEKFEEHDLEFPIFLANRKRIQNQGIDDQTWEAA
jgi:hypothetical protein